MKIIKHWWVKLYQHSQQSPLMSIASNGASGGGGVLKRLIAEGYSNDKVTLPHRDGFITLLTAPYDAELTTFRADVVDSIVCTPVYEDEEEAKADSVAVKGRYNYDTFKAASKPLIQWLNENANPHASVIVDCTGAELLVGEIAFNTKEFLKD
ncbi:hypothetical protein B9J96_04470 [Enterobacter roggenkampii]|uniref:hypothetical protein n=1 Tax=Enterobacter roggenkampii TaxID=1812935 RepID=UPI000B3B4F2E|nr:hypothetical protein [Enterobacter roggenkampii]OUR39022.1 hypothetical protein B9J96_04470 [Enterobacter roggenkampii]